MRHPEDGDLINCGETADHILEFGGPDVEAAGHDHVVDAVDDVEVSVVVQPTDVSGEQPAVAQSAVSELRRVPDPRHLAIAANRDFTFLPNRHGCVVAVSDLDFGEWDHPAR